MKKNKDVLAINAPIVLENVKSTTEQKKSNAKRKKILALSVAGAFLIALTFGILALTDVLFQRGPTYTEGLEYKLINNSFYEVSLGNATDKDIKVAPEYNKLPVKQIANQGFGESYIESIVMPDSIISIGIQAFYNCRGLEKITIPNSVTTIGNYAFSYCMGLTSLTIGSGVTNIGNWAFYECINLTSIIIPDSVTSINLNAFDSCTSLTSLTIGSGVTNIDIYAYSYDGTSYFVNLTGIVIPGSLTSITVSSENSVYMSDGNCLLTRDGKTLILGCKNSIIPNSVTRIGDYAFYNCTSLTSIIILNSVTNIGNYAFYKCANLTIYCEAKNEPEEWSSSWNYSNCTVVWGYIL